MTEDTAIIRPDSILKGAGEVIAYGITNAFSDDSMREILYEIGVYS